MKTKKVGTTVFLTPHQRKALAKLQAVRGDSMGHLVREGINLVLAKYAKEAK
jgi:hypothetical protein